MEYKITDTSRLTFTYQGRILLNMHNYLHNKTFIGFDNSYQTNNLTAKIHKVLKIFK